MTSVPLKDPGATKSTMLSQLYVGESVATRLYVWMMVSSYQQPLRGTRLGWNTNHHVSKRGKDEANLSKGKVWKTYTTPF